MFNFSFKNKDMVKDLAREIARETSKEFRQMNAGQQNQLEEIKLAIGALVDKIESLENRLTSKELKDRQDYGHLQYKISELQTDFDKK